MTDDKPPRPIREQFTASVRFSVAESGKTTESVAHNISAGGIYIRTDTPEPVGSRVVIELELPDGQPLCLLFGVVRHSRPATVPGEKHAGMGVEIVELDEGAKLFLDFFEKKPTPKSPAEKTPDVAAAPRTPPPIRHDGPVVGIDLGTSNSCVAYLAEDRPEVLSSPRGYQSLPSILFLDEKELVDIDFDITFDDPSAEAEQGSSPRSSSALADLDGLSYRVGHQAQEQMILKPARAIYGSKRFLGRAFASNEVQTLGHFFTYDIVEGPEGQAAARIGERTISLESVAACVLLVLKEMAEHHLGQSVSRAVITVPAHFGETQRAAVKEAAHRAGFFVEKLINEPTSAALGYCFDRRLEKTLLVYDLGGGTFDTSVLRVSKGGIQVLASEGNPFLGGSDFDDRLTEYVLMSLEKGDLPAVRQDPVAVQRVRFSVELVKKQLSQVKKVSLSIPHIGRNDQGPVHVDMVLDRELFERLTTDLVERTLTIVEHALTRAGISGEDIDEVLMVGGQSRSPLVGRVLGARFGQKLSKRVHPDEAVALGAAVLAHRVEKGAMPALNDILSATLSIGARDGTALPVFERGTQLPAEAELDIAPLKGSQKVLTLYRGEEKAAAKNALVGAITFPDISQNEEQVLMVSFKLSGDGILSVRIRDPITTRYADAEVRLRQ